MMDAMTRKVVRMMRERGISEAVVRKLVRLTESTGRPLRFSENIAESRRFGSYAQMLREAAKQAAARADEDARDIQDEADDGSDYSWLDAEPGDKDAQRAAVSHIRGDMLRASQLWSDDHEVHATLRGMSDYLGQSMHDAEAEDEQEGESETSHGSLLRSGEDEEESSSARDGDAFDDVSPYGSGDDASVPTKSGRSLFSDLDHDNITHGHEGDGGSTLPPALLPKRRIRASLREHWSGDERAEITRLILDDQELAGVASHVL